ncbi:MAG: L-lactate permease [Clostridiales Family XIII bacterium]|jgi:lactate permease|nr:L-lactate permease [Clostridiales Family XIII bacterium]
MGIPLTATNRILALSPILLLFFGILALKQSAHKAGGAVWVFTAVLAAAVFKLSAQGLFYACGKGLSLSLYVLLIIWTAVFLYNVADRAGAVRAIGNTVTGLVHDRLLQCLLLAWCFTSLLQGLAGFGVPVAVVAPIMTSMGFEPLAAAAACLVGHSWAISFGSMGSSYNTIQLVTKIPGEVIGPAMAMLFVVPIFVTGLSVLHIQDGFRGVARGFAPFFPAACLISLTLWGMNKLGMAQLASLVAAASGVAVLLVCARIRDGGASANRDPARARGGNSAKVPARTAGEPGGGEDMRFLIAAMPYILLICVSLITQIPFVKDAFSGFALGFDYPEITTGLGYTVPAVKGYSAITWISHPAPALFLSAIAGYFLYVKKTGADPGLLKRAAADTVKKIIPVSAGITAMVMTALIMSDSGMTNLLARGIASAMGPFFPLASPFIGMIGSFLTGSNTNSNVMFGLLQYETALAIGKNAVWLAAAQSVGGSVGVSISPAAIMMGSANVGLAGRENTVMAKTLRYCLIGAAVLAIAVFLIA